MADTKTVQITGVGRPSRRLKQIATELHGGAFAMSIESMLIEAKAVNALAGALERAIQAGTATNGSVDFKDAAIHLMREMRRNQKR